MNSSSLMLTNFHILSQAIKLDWTQISAAFLLLRTRSAGARAESRGQLCRIKTCLQHSTQSTTRNSLNK